MDWEFDHETLATKVAKMRKKQDGEVDNPVSSPRPSARKSGLIEGGSKIPKGKRSTPQAAPVYGTCRR